MNGNGASTWETWFRQPSCSCNSWVGPRPTSVIRLFGPRSWTTAFCCRLTNPKVNSRSCGADRISFWTNHYTVVALLTNSKSRSGRKTHCRRAYADQSVYVSTATIFTLWDLAPSHNAKTTSTTNTVTRSISVTHPFKLSDTLTHRKRIKAMKPARQYPVWLSRAMNLRNSLLTNSTICRSRKGSSSGITAECTTRNSVAPAAASMSYAKSGSPHWETRSGEATLVVGQPRWQMIGPRDSRCSESRTTASS